MICIELGHNEKPLWWDNFMNYIFPDHRDSILLNRDDWGKIVNSKLLEFGGRLNRNYHKSYFYITFRVESNYTMFLLRFN